jgi:drug/metabolite transporter (DMT)-like permease
MPRLILTRLSHTFRKPIAGNQTRGLAAALSSALFLGLAPVFGRQAILLGIPPLAVVALRTLFAALLLLTVMFIFYRRFLFIYPAGLLGCLLAGWINGLGSLFYYSALGRIGAGVGQLLYSLYPLFLVLFLALDKQPPTRLTFARLIIALPAIYLLSHTSAAPGQRADLIGVFLMLVAAALYALHVPINQRVLLDMPAPTVTLYTLLSMSAIVVPVFLFSGGLTDLIDMLPAVASLSSTDTSLAPLPATTSLMELAAPVLALTLVTFLSRITLFLGVKHLGSMQTVLIGLSELLVTLIFAHIVLSERLTTVQWIGAGLLVFSLALMSLERGAPRKPGAGGFLSWLRPSTSPTDSWSPPS